MRALGKKWMFAVIGMALSASAGAADPLPAETRLVATATAPRATESEFDIAAATDLTVTLKDLQSPAALASASLVITQGDQLVASANLAPPATTASIEVTGAVGHFSLRVVGAPDPARSVGYFTVCVAPKSDPSACIQNASLAGNVTSQGTTADPTLSTPVIDFDVITAGTYTVSFADLQFPASLSAAPNLALFQGSVKVSLGIASGTPLFLSAGKYRLLAIAQADPTVKAGLFGVSIVGPDVVLDDTLAVGALGRPVTFNNPAAQSLTMTVADFGFPSTLANAAAIVTVGSTKLGGTSAGGGPAVFAAPASGTNSVLKLWTSASAGVGAGTYGVDIAGGSGSLFSSAYGVAGGQEQAFAFVTPSLDAGSYKAAVTDFEFPSVLSSLKFAVVQNGSLLQQSATAGSVDFTAIAGPVVLLVAAQTPASGNGLFAASVKTAGTTPQILFDKTQGVSNAGLFDVQEISLGTTAGFDVTLSDLRFPGAFQDLALVVSRGGVVLGKIFGGGTFSIAGSPGTFQLTFISTPAAQQQYGLYAVKVVAAAPTLTLAATPTTLVEGESTTLNWTTADADSCVASGGNWTGGKAVGTGSEVVKVDATTTFTLTCAGAGGSTAKTVTVSATAKPTASKGGGGAFDWTVLSLLLALFLVRRRADFAAAR